MNVIGNTFSYNLIRVFSKLVIYPEIEKSHHRAGIIFPIIGNRVFYV
jgi:hypothetical protein